MIRGEPGRAADDVRVATPRFLAYHSEGYLGVFIGLACGLVVPVLQVAQLPPFGIGTERWGWDDWLFVVLGMGFGFAQMLAALIGRRGRLAVAFGALATLAPLVSLVAGARLIEAARRHAYDRIARTGDRVVAAVEAYARENGRPPETLDELPDGAPRDLVVPGYRDGRCYRYARIRPGATPAREQVWVVSGADPSSYRLLSVFYAASGAFLKATSTADQSIAMPFDSLAWEREPDRRVAMSADLARGLTSGAIPLSSALKVLRKPCFDFETPVTSWSLSAPLFRVGSRDAVLYYSPDGAVGAGSGLQPRTRHGRWWFLTDRE